MPGPQALVGLEAARDVIGPTETGDTTGPMRIQAMNPAMNGHGGTMTPGGSRTGGNAPTGRPTPRTAMRTGSQARAQLSSRSSVLHHVVLVFGMIHMAQQDAGVGACSGIGPPGPSLEDKVVGGPPGTWLGDAMLHVCL